MAINALDLTKGAPRSPRVRLGGYAILPRILDKCRAVIAAQQGEYKFNCPLDERFFEFTGIKADALKKQLAAGKSDSEVLAWINKGSTTKPSAPAIAAWSIHQEQRGPTDVESRQYFNELHSKLAPQREDVATWFELLDVDDYVSFGGKA